MMSADDDRPGSPAAPIPPRSLFKVIVIGDYAVGKTSLIKRYTEGYFTASYKLTIGVDFAVKSLERPTNWRELRQQKQQQQQQLQQRQQATEEQEQQQQQQQQQQQEEEERQEQQQQQSPDAINDQDDVAPTTRADERAPSPSPSPSPASAEGDALSSVASAQQQQQQQQQQQEQEQQQLHINLQLWDVAGHERFGTMTKVYYKYAIAAVIVFDLTRPATFEAVLKWREDVNQRVALANDEPIPAILLANKCDAPGVQIDREALDRFTREHGFVAWYETSAALDVNVDAAFETLVDHILDVASANVVQRPKNTVQLSPDAGTFTDGARDVGGGRSGGVGSPGYSQAGQGGSSSLAARRRQRQLEQQRQLQADARKGDSCCT